MFSSFNIKDIKLHAHSTDNIPDELFYIHCELTAKYAKKIINTYRIEPIIKNILTQIDSTNTEQVFNIDKIITYIKELIIFHDLGKLTKDFQDKLKGGNNKYTHSDKSYFVIIYQLCLLLNQGDINTKEFLLLWCIAYTVYKHHSVLIDYFDEIEKIPQRLSDKVNYLQEIFINLKTKIDDEIIEKVMHENFWKSFNRYPARDLIDLLINNELTFFTLLKLIYSILVSSDYFATMEYQTGEEFDFEVFNENKINCINNDFHLNREIDENFNPAINEKAENYRKKEISSFKKINNDKEKTRNNFNELRSFINIKAEDNLKDILNKNKNGRSYFLNIPTGGGKTNISMRLALSIMRKRNICKLFYVLPFTNLIEQSYSSLNKYIGEENCTRLDSKFINLKENEEEAVTLYKENLFYNYPVLFMSHVKFFDLFFRNDKKNNYNFYQLCNSVVIIDEIQAYNDALWTTLANVFGQIANILNIHFIVMSATLPELNKLADTINSSIDYLFDDEFTKDLFQHELFKRCNIKPDRKLVFGKEHEDKLTENILKKSIGTNKILIVANTVRSSFKIFLHITKSVNNKKSKFYGYKVFLLNSTILDFQRKYIINLSKNKNTKIILIATQSVEAGVDLDFDIGFRAYAPLDSIVQVEGRINRNNSKDTCELYIYKDDSFKNIYRGDYKAKATTEIENDFFSLGNESFDTYNGMVNFYKEVVNKIYQDDNTAFLSSSIDYVKDMKRLRFKSIDKNIHLIEGESISLFIPVDIDISYYPEIKNSYPEFIEDEKIIAKQVWSYYQLLIENKFDFNDVIKIKQFRKVLIPFIVNVFDRYTGNGRLSSILAEESKYGFYYCDDYQNYYSIETGLDVDKFIKIKNGREALFL